MKIFSFIIFSIFLFSCVSLDLKTRKGKDIEVNESNFNVISQTINYLSIDSIQLAQLFLEKNDWIIYDSVEIKSIYPDILIFNFFQEDSIIKKYEKKISFENGYVVLTKESKNTFEAGPFLWTNSDFIRYLGITSNKDIVLLTYTGGTMFCLFFPIMAANTQGELIYLKK